jgi:hypothetical protein
MYNNIIYRNTCTFYYLVSGHKIVKNPPPSYKGENYYCFLLATPIYIAGYIKYALEHIHTHTHTHTHTHIYIYIYILFVYILYCNYMRVMVITSRETRCTFTFYYILFIALLYSYIIVQMFNTYYLSARLRDSMHWIYSEK